MNLRPISKLIEDNDFLHQESLAEEHLSNLSREQNIGDRNIDGLNSRIINSISSLSNISEEEESKMIHSVKVDRPANNNLVCDCKPKIMIVDDNVYNIQAIEMQLEFWGL